MPYGRGISNAGLGNSEMSLRLNRFAEGQLACFLNLRVGIAPGCPRNTHKLAILVLGVPSFAPEPQYMSQENVAEMFPKCTAQFSYSSTSSKFRSNSAHLLPSTLLFSIIDPCWQCMPPEVPKTPRDCNSMIDSAYMHPRIAMQIRMHMHAHGLQLQLQ